MNEIGERIQYAILNPRIPFNERQIELCQNLFYGLSENARNDIIVIGVLNFILDAFQDDEKRIKEIDEFIKDQKPVKKRYVRYC